MLKIELMSSIDARISAARNVCWALLLSGLCCMPAVCIAQSMSTTMNTQVQIFLEGALIRDFTDFVSVCSRSGKIRRAIERAVGKANCQDITEGDVNGIFTLNVSSGGTGLACDEEAPDDALTQLLPGDFQGLINVLSLELDQNRIIDVPDFVFVQLRSLGLLTWRNNGISDLPVSLSEQTQLRNLSLTCTKPKDGIPPNFFDQLVNLESLDLSQMDLLTLPEGIFNNLRKLTFLDLSGDIRSSNQLNLSGDPPDAVTSATFNVIRGNLQFLDLSRNEQMSGTLPENFFHELTSLHTLKISNMNITSFPENLFKNLRVSVLDISNNVQTSATLPLNLFKPLPGLVDLEMINMGLRTLPLGIFSDYTTTTSVLQRVDLRGNPLGKAYCDDLNERLGKRMDFPSINKLERCDSFSYCQPLC